MAPKKKKNSPKNAYFFFMQQYRRDAEARGVHFNSIQEVSEVAAPKWNAMSREQRAPFELLAIQAKNKGKTDLENKFTSQGKSYAQLESEAREEREKERRMIQEIEETVLSLNASSGFLLRHPFYFAHVNYYCQKDGTYYPCEIAVARFTIRTGVADAIHSFVELDDIPPGYRYEATKISETTHNIPLPPNNGERNYYKLLMDVRKFLLEGHEDDKLPPLYTMPAHLDPVSNVLEFLENSSNFEPGQSSFRVYPITKLFFELRRSCARYVKGDGFPVVSLAERELEKDMFNFSPGISCDFHEDKDSAQYCSLSIVKRWCFLISDHCCQDVGVALIPGSHVPIRSDTSRNMMMKEAPVFGNGAIPKAQPTTVTFIDHSKLTPSEKDSRHFNMSSFSEVSVRHKKPAPPPLRQPNTLPLGVVAATAATAAAAVVQKKEPKFTAEDFPAFGGLGGGGEGGVFGKIPMAVSGRGRGNPWFRKETETSGIGRGYGLAASLAALDIKKESE